MEQSKYRIKGQVLTAAGEGRSEPIYGSIDITFGAPKGDIEKATEIGSHLLKEEALNWPVTVTGIEELTWLG